MIEIEESSGNVYADLGVTDAGEMLVIGGTYSITTAVVTLK